MILEAERDKNIVAVHAGMGMEPSLRLFKDRFPDKFFDVGMAEQHAVTFSAGLACSGLKPFCIIPSAFLQRAYDQVLALTISNFFLYQISPQHFRFFPLRKKGLKSNKTRIPKRTVPLLKLPFFLLAL